MKPLAGIFLATFRLVVITFSMLITVVLGIILKFFKLLDQEKAFVIRTWWCKFALHVLGIKIIHNEFPALNSASLFVSNHRSLIDPVILFSFIRNGYAVSKAEVRNYPVINKGAELSGVVYVDRTDKDSRSATRKAIAQSLTFGHSVVLFPEGTISIQRQILPFRKGGFEACAESNCQVVPIAMEYMNPRRDFWFSKHLLVQFYVTFSKWKTEVRLHFFDPFKCNNAKENCEDTARMIQAKLDDFQKFWLTGNIPAELTQIENPAKLN